LKDRSATRGRAQAGFMLPLRPAAGDIAPQISLDLLLPPLPRHEVELADPVLQAVLLCREGDCLEGWLRASA